MPWIDTVTGSSAGTGRASWTVMEARELAGTEKDVEPSNWRSLDILDVSVPLHPPISSPV